MLNAKEGQTYVCIKSDRPWWTKGKEYEVVLTSYGQLALVDDDGAKWQINQLNNHCQFKLKDNHSFTKYGKLMFLMDEIQAEKTNAAERKYTPFDVNKVINKAYQKYNNDAQRLAYIKGYFAK